MWIVVVKRQTESVAHCWLLEVMTLDNGAMISTGRQTPKYPFDMVRGTYENVVERLEHAVEFLTAESVSAVDEETLMIAAELGEGLGCLKPSKASKATKTSKSIKESHDLDGFDVSDDLDDQGGDD